MVQALNKLSLDVATETRVGRVVHWNCAVDAARVLWVSFDRVGSTANTLSAEVLDELNALLKEVDQGQYRGVVLRSGKPNGFIAGADVGEFTRVSSVAEARALAQRGWDAFARLARLRIPSVALVQGYCLGGGLELALACRYRVLIDAPETRLALPEVMLGIVPAWGGMMRLPQKIGAAAALDLMLTGRGVDARRAAALGLADACVPARVADNAARRLIDSQPPPRQPGLFARLSELWPLRTIVAGMARKQVAQRARSEHYPAPYAILDIWQRFGGNVLAVPDGHPASLAALLEGPTARNLIRVFKLQERLKGQTQRGEWRAKRVHVIGAGVMGGDIAAWCAYRGLIVSLADTEMARIAPALLRAGEFFRRRLKDSARRQAALDRLIPDAHGDGVAQADVVIEAIVENAEVKRDLFKRILPRMKPDAVLATNTSSLKLQDLTRGMHEQGRLVGIHFFNPVAQMPLIEIVHDVVTDPTAVARACAFARQIDKLPLAVKSVPGFLVNRVLAPYLDAALRALDEGIPGPRIDAAALDFGMPMGPIELADTVGLDVCLAVGRIVAKGEVTAPRALEQAIAAGHLGKKTGRGFYIWHDGKALKPVQHFPPDPQLTARLIEPLIDEARRCVDEGIVEDADSADAGIIFGTGFAPFRGGPLHFASERAAAP
jgi:3-hydroxyacyl-CoA dehydrogenase/enoyl-CoA hydratase/3-hydroxybutyryl-CoA epimerase